MKNVVFIVVDSLCYDYIGKQYNAKSTTPFLDSIIPSSVFATNCYSQGPYTEAGTKALLCGTDALDDKGYLFRFEKSKYYITDYFRERGFETFGLLYPTCVLSDRTLKNIDHMLYTSGFMFDVLWSQKLLYYVDLFEKDLLTEAEYQDVEDLMQLIFDAWIDFMDVKDHPEKYELLHEELQDYPWEEYCKTLKAEEKKFRDNPRAYITDLFAKKQDHILNSIPCIDFGKMIHNDAISKAFSENKPLIEKIKRVQYRLNKKNNKVPNGTLGKVVLRIKKGGVSKYTFGEYLYRKQLLSRWKDCKTMCREHEYKLLLSSHSQLTKIADILNNTPTDKPKFIISHIEEPHYFNTFFSYDYDDAGLISEELKYAEEFVDSVESEYKGLLSYQLAVRYVDRELGYLFEELKKSGKIEDTMIVIVADHGSSYNCIPLRSRMVNNFHTENYHIPLLIYDGENCGTFSKMCTSKDVLATIFDLLKMEKPSELTGESILKGECDYSILEYMGPGCPDMRRRPVWMAIRNDEYLVCYVGKLLDGFSEDRITEIYDLRNDKEELKNLASFRNASIDRLIGLLKERFTQVYENNKDWLTR